MTLSLPKGGFSRTIATSGFSRTARVLLTLAAFLLLNAHAAAGQVQAGASVERDRATYHFDNPSSIDTADLVPHFFEQNYVLDNVWLTASARYHAGAGWVTSAGATPVVTHTATDYDTFFDPDGSVWVAGTTGDARVHSWRAAQMVDLGRRGPIELSGGYAVRVDLADFLAGDRTVTRDGRLLSASTVTTREHTNAQRHDIFITGAWRHEVAAGLEMRVSLDIVPASVSRVRIELPDKYPGQSLVYGTSSARTIGTVEVVRTAGPLPMSFAIDGGTVLFSYREKQWVTRHTVGLSVTLRP